MKECLGEEILQAYFDGELTGERMEAAALHLAGCRTCSASLRELESEADLLFSALAPEFEAPVPTERLQRRINAAITGLQVVSPARQVSISTWRDWLASLLTLTPQRTFGYAGLAVVLAFAVIFAMTYRRSNSPVATTQQILGKAPVNVRPSPVDQQKQTDNSSPADHDSAVAHAPKKLKPIRRNRTNTTPLPSNPVVAENEVKLLPGERSYLKTIAALDNTINSEKRTMRPALQAEYERNLALVDRAIAATRSAAKRNPNDPDAADFMFAAYQSKVDLLNTIADARVYNRPR